MNTAEVSGGREDLLSDPVVAGEFRSSPQRTESRAEFPGSDCFLRPSFAPKEGQLIKSVRDTNAGVGSSHGKDAFVLFPDKIGIPKETAAEPAPVFSLSSFCGH
ncbi:MAG: hypothetical protein ACE5HZ_05960 [Fidelibacterota bacterium]